MAAAKGNQYGAKERVWAAAINRALHKRKSKIEGMKAVDELALVLLDKCADGDMTALKELGDRLDGKPTQTVDATVDASLIVEVVKFADTVTK